MSDEKNEIEQLIDNMISSGDELVDNLKNPEYYTDKILKDLKISGNNVLQSIINKYPNKVIYIDIWAPWCGPCMGEMKSSNELHEKYKTKDIVFVYFASRCTEKSWKISIAKNNINGKHILLNENQSKLLSDKLKISGIPHYILIDKNGIIVNRDAPRPSETEKLSNIFDELIESE